MVCLRLIGHHIHGNRRAGRRDRVKDDGLHIFPGPDQSGPVSYTHLDVYKRQELDLQGYGYLCVALVRTRRQSGLQAGGLVDSGPGSPEQGIGQA